MLNRQFSFNSSKLIALSILIYVAYYLLLVDNCLHSSISSIISYSHHHSIKHHMLVLGLLPIYIATMIFGAAMLGSFLGARLEKLRIRCTFKKK